MPIKSEKLGLKIPKEYNKTRKLTEKERTKIKELYSKISQRKLAKIYNVSRRLIIFIGCPEKYEISKAIRRTKHKLYYNKEKNKEYKKRVREHRKELLKKELLIKWKPLLN